MNNRIKPLSALLTPDRIRVETGHGDRPDSLEVRDLISVDQDQGFDFDEITLIDKSELTIDEVDVTPDLVDYISAMTLDTDYLMNWEN